MEGLYASVVNAARCGDVQVARGERELIYNNALWWGAAIIHVVVPRLASSKNNALNFRTRVQRERTRDNKHVYNNLPRNAEVV